MKRSLLMLASLLVAFSTQAQDWINPAGGNWSDGLNWSTTPAAPANDGSANILFNTNYTAASVVDVAYSINSLTFGTSVGGWTINGSSALTIGAGGITNNGAPAGGAAQVINAPITIGASQTWNPGNQNGVDREIDVYGVLTGASDKTITVTGPQTSNMFRKFVVGANNAATLAANWVVDNGGRLSLRSGAYNFGTGSITVNAGGVLGNEGGSSLITNSITLAGGALGGMGFGNGGAISGNINIISNSFVTHAKGASGMNIASAAGSVISGSGNLSVIRPTGANLYTLLIGNTGSAVSNNNTGVLYINDNQIVQLQKGDNVVAWGGDIVINSGSLRYQDFRENQINDTATVTINQGGSWNLQHGLIGNAANQQVHEKIGALVVNASANAFINDYSTPDEVTAGPAVKARILLGGASASGTGDPGIFVNSGGSISGTGVVNKVTTVVDGTLAPGTSVGTLGFGTNLTVESTGVTLLEVSTTAASGNDKFTVAGDLVLNGNPVMSLVALSGAANLDTSAPYVLATVAGTITGSYSTTPTWVGTAPANAGLFTIVTDATLKQVRLQQGTPTVPTTTTVGSSLNPSEYSQSVTFTATVSPGAATGTVTFKDGGVTIGTGTLSAGSATFVTNGLALGSHSITAEYGGDSTYIGSVSSPVIQTVNAKTTGTATTTTLASSLNPSELYDSVTFTATVDQPSATGWMQFKDGASLLGTAAVTSGVATYSTSLLSTGAHSMTAVYSGDAVHAGNTSPVLNQTVNLTPTVYAYDGFTNSFTDLFGAIGGTGWSSSPAFWYVYNGQWTSHTSQSGTMSFPTNITSTPAGNLLFSAEDTALERIARNLGTNAPSGIIKSGSPAQRYLSFLIRVAGSFPENADTGVGLGKDGDNSANVYFKINSFLFKLDVDTSFTSSSTSSTNTLFPAANTTYFVVMKVTSDAGGNYQAFAKIYDSAADAVADSDSDPGFGWDITSPVFASNGKDLDRVVVRHGFNTVELDEVRLGNTWYAVAPTVGAAPVPVPTMTIAKSGSNVVIEWPAVSTGYTLKSSANLTTPFGSWASEGTGSLVGTNYQVTLPANTGTKFFRLVK